MRKLCITLITATIALAACGGGTPVVIQVTATPAAESPPMSTEAAPTTTERTLVGPQATAMALAQQITLVAPTAGPAADDYVGMIEHAWQLVNENYYSDEFNGVDWEAKLEEYRGLAEDVQTQEEFWALMDDFIGQLGDDHSNFRTPAEVSAQYGSGQSSGLPWSGISMWPPPGRPTDYLLLWEVCSNGPAAFAGLETGDKVLAVNGDPVEITADTDMEPWIRRVMFGDGDSSELTLTVQQGPNQGPRDVRLQLGGASGCGGWIVEIVNDQPRVGYIRIPDFGRGADTVLQDSIAELEADGALDALILDVRHNPGGLDLVQNNAVSFFTIGEFGTVGPTREGRTRTIFRVRGPVEWSETTPVVLLVDESSHSAADYFSVAMSLSGRATLVGMPTAGNTDAWTSSILPDGSLIGIAISILLLPDGTSIEGIGAQPDVMVPLGEWGLKQSPDIQFAKALEIAINQAGG